MFGRRWKRKYERLVSDLECVSIIVNGPDGKFIWTQDLLAAMICAKYSAFGYDVVEGDPRVRVIWMEG